MRRKDLIREIEMIEALIENFDCEVMRKSYQSSLVKMKNAEKERENTEAIKELMEMAI